MRSLALTNNMSKLPGKSMPMGGFTQSHGLQILFSFILGINLYCAITYMNTARIF